MRDEPQLPLHTDPTLDLLARYTIANAALAQPGTFNLDGIMFDTEKEIFEKADDDFEKAAQALYGSTPNSRQGLLALTSHAIALCDDKESEIYHALHAIRRGIEQQSKGEADGKND